MRNQTYASGRARGSARRCARPCAWARREAPVRSGLVVTTWLVALLLGGAATATGATVTGTTVTGGEPAPLRSIEIQGLRRTREQVILEIITLEPGDLVTAAAITEIEEEIIDSGIFAAVQVEPIRPTDAPDTTDLRITVREKWTLIPIPFFATDGTTARGGLILLESNVLGRRKQLITAAFAGNEGFNGFLAYVDPSVFGSPWSWRFSAGSGLSETAHELPDGTTVREYSAQVNRVSTGVSYRLSRDVRSSLGVQVFDRNISSFSGGLDPVEPDEGLFLEPEVSLRYDGTRPRGVLRHGPETELSARLVSGTGYDLPGWEVSGYAAWAVPFVPTLEGRLRGRLAGGYGTMRAGDKAPVSARDGFRTLPYQRSVADRWVSSAGFVDLPVFRPRWGALVLSHYWEWGAFDADAHELQYFGGPGGGFRIYLQEVAIPAVGLDFAYNLVDPGFVFSFTVGAQM